MRKIAAAGILAGLGLGFWLSRPRQSRPGFQSAAQPEAERNLPSYQTAPLTEYRPEFQTLAREIFEHVQSSVGPRRAHRFKGSYSFFAHGNPSTLAKVVIFENDKGKVNGHWPVRDGVYVFTRCAAGEPDSIGVAPAHSERFNYHHITRETLNEALALIFEATGNPRLGARRVEASAREAVAER